MVLAVIVCLLRRSSTEIFNYLAYKVRGRRCVATGKMYDVKDGTQITNQSKGDFLKLSYRSTKAQESRMKLGRFSFFKLERVCTS